MDTLPGDSDDMNSGDSVSLQSVQFMGRNVSPMAAILSWKILRHHAVSDKTQTDEGRVRRAGTLYKSDGQSVGDATIVENMLGCTLSFSSSSPDRHSETMEDCTMLLIAEIDCLPPSDEVEDRALAVHRIWSIVKRAKEAISPGVELSRELVLADEWIQSGSDVGIGLSNLEATIEHLPDKGRTFASIAHGESSDWSKSIDFTVPLPEDMQLLDGFVIDKGSATEEKQAHRIPRRNPSRQVKSIKPASGLRRKMTAKHATGGVARMLDLGK